MRKQFIPNPKQRGSAAMVGTVGMLIILAMLLPLLINWMNHGLQVQRQRAAARHLAEVNAAVGEYVRHHYDELLTQAAAASGPTVTIDMLVDDELLPDGFGLRNPWGQEYAAYVRQPEPGTLEAVTLTLGGSTAGRDFITNWIPGAAAMMGGAGGFIPSANMPGQSAGMLVGSFGGWRISLADRGIPSPGAGHLGARAAFDTSSMEQDFLYRVAVPGHPDLNAMFTTLDMRDHAVADVREVRFTPHVWEDMGECGDEREGRVFLDPERGLYVCRDGKAHTVADTGNSRLLSDAALVANGALIDKPICPPGTDTEPQIFVAPSIISANEKSPPLAAMQAWATSESDTQWRVHLRVLKGDGKGWIYPEANYGRVMAMALCAGNDNANP